MIGVHSNATRRKWFQFNLRTLFAILLLTGPVAHYAPQLFGRLFLPEQQLPSAFWDKSSIQYFPAGSEFTLSREAQALREARAGAGMTIGDADSRLESNSMSKP